MKKLAKSLWIKKEEGIYTIGLTPELQDDVGTVGFVEYNKKAEEDPTLLNSPNEEESWIVKLTNINEEEFNKFVDYK